MAQERCVTCQQSVSSSNRVRTTLGSGDRISYCKKDFSAAMATGLLFGAKMLEVGRESARCISKQKKKKPFPCLWQSGTIQILLAGIVGNCETCNRAGTATKCIDFAGLVVCCAARLTRRRRQALRKCSVFRVRCAKWASACRLVLFFFGAL